MCTPPTALDETPIQHLLSDRRAGRVKMRAGLESCIYLAYHANSLCMVYALDALIGWCVGVCVHACVGGCVHGCVGVCVHGCVDVCACVCGRVCGCVDE